jgi:hypothetical protein
LLCQKNAELEGKIMEKLIEKCPIDYDSDDGCPFSKFPIYDCPNCPLVKGHRYMVKIHTGGLYYYDRLEKKQISLVDMLKIINKDADEQLIKYCETRHNELKIEHQNRKAVVTPWQSQELFDWGAIEGKMVMLEEMMNRLQIPYIPFDSMKGEITNANTQ